MVAGHMRHAAPIAVTKAAVVGAPQAGAFELASAFGLVAVLTALPEQTLCEAGAKMMQTWRSPLIPLRSAM